MSGVMGKSGNFQHKPNQGFQLGNQFGALNKGVKRTDSYRNTMSIKMQNNKNGFKPEDGNINWNPDREAVKRNLRNDAIYHIWVRKVKYRDKICKLKNEKCDGYLVVHHIKPWRDFPELRYELTNGITLCQAHHPRTRAEEKRLMPVFQELMPVLNV